MIEVLVYLGIAFVIIKIVDFIVGTRELLRQQAEEAAEAALSDPDSPQSQALREEMDRLLLRK